MKKVLVLLAEGFEEVEAVTVIDLLRRAGFGVTACGLGDGPDPVRASRGVLLVPDASLAAVLESGEGFDLVVLPGGQPGTDNLRADRRVLDLLRRQHEAGRMTAAICAAPMVLAAAGILDGGRATSYPGCLESMDLPAVELSSEPVVVSGRVVTSRGPGTAMDFALTLIGLLGGDGLRGRVEAGLQRCA